MTECAVLPYKTLHTQLAEELSVGSVIVACRRQFGLSSHVEKWLTAASASLANFSFQPGCVLSVATCSPVQSKDRLDTWIEAKCVHAEVILRMKYRVRMILQPKSSTAICYRAHQPEYTHGRSFHPSGDMQLNRGINRLLCLTWWSTFSKHQRQALYIPFSVLCFSVSSTCGAKDFWLVFSLLRSKDSCFRMSIDCIEESRMSGQSPWHQSCGRASGKGCHQTSKSLSCIQIWAVRADDTILHSTFISVSGTFEGIWEYLLTRTHGKDYGEG